MGEMIDKLDWLLCIPNEAAINEILNKYSDNVIYPPNWHNDKEKTKCK